MKKLILSLAIVLGAISVQAAVPSINTTMSQSVTIQDEYKEVSLDALPDAVKSTLEKSFPGSTLEKAYKNEKNEFKLEIANGDKKYTVYIDAGGNILKK